MSGQQSEHQGRDAGFTLVELLIAIVLVGILAAVAVVGIGRLTEQAAGASCRASADAAVTAANTYLVGAGTYPASFVDLTASVAGAAPLLVLPEGAVVSTRGVAVDRWTLTMSPTDPPTFSCATTTASASTTTTAPLATTTTAATTTTTTVVSNGVTATASTAGDQRYYGEDIVTLTNSAAITDLTVTITVARTTGVSYLGQYTNFWSGAVANASTSTSGSIVYTFTTNPGQQIVAGTWGVHTQINGTGTVHPTSGDTWTVTSTSAGITRTLNGTF